MTVDFRWYFAYCVLVNILTIVAVICFRRWLHSPKSQNFRTKWTNRVNRIKNLFDKFLDRCPILVSITSVLLVVLSVSWKILKVFIKITLGLALLVIYIDSAMTSGDHYYIYYD